MEDPWVGRAVALYQVHDDQDLPIIFLIIFQLFTLLIIPLLLSIGCYQAVIRWAPDSVKG